MLRRSLLVLSLLVLAAGLVLFDVPLCPSAALLGIPCPGCGLTRATLALLSFDPARAFSLHPLVFVLAPLYFGLLAAAALGYVRGPKARPAPSWISGRWLTRGAWLLLSLVLLVWAARFAGVFGGPVEVRPITPFGKHMAR